MFKTQMNVIYYSNFLMYSCEISIVIYLANYTFHLKIQEKINNEAL